MQAACKARASYLALEMALSGSGDGEYGRPMEFRVLGSFEVLERGERLPLGGPKQRLVLAHLLIRADRVVSVESLIEDIWGEEPPEAARSALQAYVSRLRKVLGPERLEGRPPGYILNTRPGEVDAVRFERLVRDGRDRLGADPKGSADLLERGIVLFRGSPFADLAEWLSLQPEIARLEQLHLEALEDRTEATLALGRPADTALLERLVAQHPLRERFWGQLMIALYRSGRQGDALEAYRRARERLAEDLGIDPSPDLQKLHDRILRQDPDLVPAGEALRGYRLLEKVGEGPFGVVHRAVQPQLEREVAVKAIHPRYADDPAFIRRFEAEAQVIAGLDHPRIVPLHDYWRDPSGAYLVMRYLRGGNLRERLSKGPLEPAAIARIVDEVADALDAAHSNGVVHGDVKPENVLFDEHGNAYLTDFRFATNGEATAAADVHELAASLAEVLSTVPGDGIPAPAQEVVSDAAANGTTPSYESAGALAAAFRNALGTAPAPDRARAAARNPYKGLRPFVESDAQDFFGREDLTDHLVELLSPPDSKFLAVVGPSGCGKSSLVRAGLVPALRRGAVPGSERWFVVEMVPGSRPFEELEDALLHVAIDQPAGLLEELEGADDGLLRAVERLLPPDGSELLLVVDQFEELFTLVRQESTRSAFLAALARCSTDPGSRLRVVVTLRADFYDRPLHYKEFADLLAGRSVVVPPPSAEELERAVAGPSEALAVVVEPAVVAQVLTDVNDQPGALPLLQYALTELFEQRADSTLTVDAYRRIGGVTGAIARRAEALFDAQGPDGKEAARQLFLRLITVGEEGTEDTRRRVLRTELTSLEVDAASIDSVIDAFGSRRLLSFDRDPVTRGPTVEVAHEALLREWTRLRGWIDGAREDVRMHRRLEPAAEEWTRAGEDPSFLLRGGRLAQFEAWAGTTDVALTGEERRYLDAATAQREVEASHERARQERERALERRSLVRLRALIAILTVAALVASGLSFVALRQRSEAQRAARVATARELASDADANLEADPQRSVLLALQALAATKVDGTALPEAVESLHRALAVDREVLTLRDPSTANVDWSPDGRLLVTGGTAGGRAEHDVVIWDARTGAKLHRLEGHSADISFVAFSPDSTRVVSAAEDGKAIVWDTRSGERLHTFAYPPEVMVGATFSPDGERLLIATLGRTRVVDVSTGRVVRDWGTYNCGVPVFSPNGTQVAEAAGELIVRDARTGRLIFHAAPPEGSCGVGYSPDGSRIMSVGGSHVSIFDANTGHREPPFLAQTPIFGFDWSPDGRTVATGSPDGTAILWNARTHERELVLRGHAGGVALVAFSPDGTRLLTGGADGTARVWDITPSGTSEAVGAGQDGGFTGVEYTPDGSGLLTSAWSGVALMNASTGARIRGYEGAGDAAFGSGGMIALQGDGITIVRASSGQVIRRIAEPKSDSGSGLAFASRAPVVAAGRLNSRVEVWNAESGKVLKVLGGPLDVSGNTQDVALSPDGRLVASMHSRAVLRVWNVVSGRKLFQVEAQTGLGTGVAFSPDGRLVATSGEDGASVWSVPSGGKVATMAAGGQMQAVAFNADGTQLATAGADGTARIWDVATGRLELILTGHQSALAGVAFSPDGTRLATVGADGSLRVYVLSVGQLEKIARARLSRGFTPAECLQYLHVTQCPQTGQPLSA
jgi:WD40 repeat protein/DNA-binding SARP family transcriptional activator